MANRSTERILRWQRFIYSSPRVVATVRAYLIKTYPCWPQEPIFYYDPICVTTVGEWYGVNLLPSILSLRLYQCISLIITRKLWFPKNTCDIRQFQNNSLRPNILGLPKFLKAANIPTPPPAGGQVRSSFYDYFLIFCFSCS